MLFQKGVPFHMYRFPRLMNWENSFPPSQQKIRHPWSNQNSNHKEILIFESKLFFRNIFLFKIVHIICWHWIFWMFVDNKVVTCRRWGRLEGHLHQWYSFTKHFHGQKSEYCMHLVQQGCEICSIWGKVIRKNSFAWQSAARKRGTNHLEKYLFYNSLII